MKKFVALYGGSFNLSTMAHRAVGAAVRDLAEPDEVWYLVSPQNPHKEKEGMAPFEDRLEMAKLNVCGLAKLVATDIEKEISEKTGSTASSDTLRELMKLYPDIHFAWVVGADAFVKLHTWHNYEFIINNVPIIVLPRAGYTDQVPDCPAARHTACPELASAAELKEKTGWFLLRQFPEGNISASAEREKVREPSQPVPRNVIPSVMEYVARKKLTF